MHSGCTSVHVNRVLQELRRDGVMDLKDRVLRFSDARRLEELGAFDPLYLHQDPKLEAPPLGPSRNSAICSSPVVSG